MHADVLQLNLAWTIAVLVTCRPIFIISVYSIKVKIEDLLCSSAREYFYLLTIAVTKAHYHNQTKNLHRHFTANQFLETKLKVNDKQVLAF